MIRSIFTATALSVVALAAGGANAQDRQPEQISVSAKHIDFSNDRETRGFYARLKVVAQNVCASEVSDPMTAMADEACAREALADAVESVGAPQLAAFHGDANRAPAYATRNVSTRQN